MADRKDSKRQERRLAVKSGGSTNAASGALPFRKHDVRSDTYLIEAKVTDRGSYSLKAKDWEDLRKTAMLEGRIPMYAIQLGKRRLVVVDEDDYPWE